ncbi:hypothetical protein RFI_38721, partial [Reticulomyxa filosa]
IFKSAPSTSTTQAQAQEFVQGLTEEQDYKQEQEHEQKQEQCYEENNSLAELNKKIEKLEKENKKLQNKIRKMERKSKDTKHAIKRAAIIINASIKRNYSTYIADENSCEELSEDDQ